MRVPTRWVSWALVVLLPGGCCGSVRECADRAVCDLAAHPVDVAPPAAVDATLPETAPPPKESSSLPTDPALLRTSAQEPKGAPPRPLLERLQVPPDLPGGRTPPIALPENAEERRAAIERLFPPLPPLGPDFMPGPGPDGCPLTLAQLQQMALANSPLVRQAAADVEAARGAVVQAGAYPNPTAGPEFDTVGTGPVRPGPGYIGGFIEQLIKTGGKLQLARAAALMDLHNAEVALHRAESDLIGQVRAGYFNVLVAQDSIRIYRALDHFSGEIYKVQVDQLKLGGQAAAYEPMQLRVLVFQARGALVQARNRHVSAWKQLAATLGLPALPPTLLAGRADMPIPCYSYDAVLAHILEAHTDVLTARNTVQRNRYNLRLQEVTPIPDVDLSVVVQKDYTSGLGEIAFSAKAGVALPLWDRNKGGIRQAQGQLLRAVEEEHRVRDDLTTRLADAFERYENNRVLLEYYRDRILPDQVRAYRGVYERHNLEPDKVTFGDVVTAQQTLAASVTAYVTTLGAMWTAVVDVSTLLQTKDLFQVCPEMPETKCLAEVPDLEHLLAPLPCCHPCSPAPEPWLKGADPHWPPAAPEAERLHAPRALAPAEEPGRAK